MRRVSRSRESGGSRDRSLLSAATSLSRRRTASVRRQGDSTPGPRLGEVVAERLTDLGADPEDAQWDSRKHGDGSWQVQLAFRAGGRLHIAEWLFDPRRRHVVPADDNANRLSLPEAELPPPTGGSLGAATVTPIRPRPDRSQPAPPHEPVMEPAEEPARAAAHAAASASFAAPRPPIGRPPSHATPQTGSPRMPVSDDEPNGTGRGPAHRAGGTGRPAPGQGTGDRNAAPAATAGSPRRRRAATGPRRRAHRAAPRPGRAAGRSAAQPITGIQAAAAQPAAAQAGPEARTASAPQGRGPGIDTDRDTDAAARVGRRPIGAPRTRRHGTGRRRTGRHGQAPGHAAGQGGPGHVGPERAATGQAATGQVGPDRAAAERAVADRAAAGRAGTEQADPELAAAATAATAQAAASSAGGPADQAARGADNARPQAPAQPAPDKGADEAPARGRGKKAASPRGRRASVPSWDEIMLGNSRQPD